MKNKLNKVLESNIFICALMSAAGLSMYMNGKNSELLGRLMAGIGILLMIEAWALYVLNEIKKMISEPLEDENQELKS